MNKDNITKFEEAFKSCKREGIDSLITYIRKSDFYTAPASTRFHSCHEGGLLEHSLNVWNCLSEKKKNNPIWKEKLSDIDDETIIVSSLLHDICKANYYTVEMKNKKVYSEQGKKIDNNGKFDWVTVPGYTVDDQHPLGHGECSAMILQSFIKLKPCELYSIRWHMGWTEPKENWNYLAAAIKKYPLVLALHEADVEATYLLEKEE